MAGVRTSSNKSEGRLATEQYFPDSFRTGKSEFKDGACVMEDTLVGIRSVGDSLMFPEKETGQIWVKNGADLVRAIKRSAEHYLGIRDCKIYCLVNDIHYLVPTIKGEEQGKRLSQSEKSQEDRKMYLPNDFVPFTELKKPYLRLNEPLPFDWKLAMCDRDNFRAWVTGWLSMQMISSSDPSCLFRLPQGKMVVLHGHYLTKEFIQEANTRLSPDAQIIIPIDNHENHVSDLILNEIPLIVTGGEDGELLKSRFAPELRNRNGEAEFAFFVLYKKLQAKFPSLKSLDILSPDTDIMLLSLIYLHKVGEESAGKITWKYSRGGWIFYTPAPKVIEEKRADINSLAAGILYGDFQGSFDSPKLKNPEIATSEELQHFHNDYSNFFPVENDCYGDPGGAIWNYIVALATASDYTSAFYGITQWRMLKALLKHTKYIGKIISYNRNAKIPVKINFENYARLIKCAYVYSTGRFDGINPEEIRVSHIRDFTEKKQKGGKKPLNEKSWYPSFWALELRKKHLTIYLHLMSQVGNDDIFEPEDVTKFGYMLIDGNKSHTRDNIIRQTQVENQEDEEKEEQKEEIMPSRKKRKVETS